MQSSILLRPFAPCRRGCAKSGPGQAERVDDDTGTRPESNGPEPDGTEARGARGTDARTADDSGAHKAHGSGAGRAHSTGDHESHDTPGHETHETHGTDNPQTHDTGARHTHGTPDRPPRDATRRQTPSTDDPRTRRTAHPRHAGPEPVDTAHRAARWEQRTEIPSPSPPWPSSPRTRSVCWPAVSRMPRGTSSSR